jgi:MoaA/NifB/PqqE/SkfB family radical SAM enzyme
MRSSNVIRTGTTEPFKRNFFSRQFPRIKAYFKGKVVPPYEAEVQPSSTCNARCYFCWGQDALRRGGRLEDLLKVGKNMRIVMDKLLEAEAEGFKIESVKFVGSTGDPLKNQKTLDAIDLLVENNRSRRLFTNGIGLTYKVPTGQTYAERLIRLNYLRISLDAGSSETLYKVKKRKEFDNIMKGIGIVRRMSDNARTGVFIHVGFVISIQNYREIEAAAQRVKDAGAHGIQYRTDLTGPTFTPEALEVIGNQLARVQGFSSSDFKVTEVRDPITLSERCFHPFFWTTVGSDGRLYPCGHRGLNFGWNMGNLLEPDVSLMDLLRQQRGNPRISSLPDKDCTFCPPNGLHASNLLNSLTQISHQSGFQGYLDALYKSPESIDDLT